MAQDPEIAVVLGIIFILLGIAFAMGSVSLGMIHQVTSSGTIEGSYLVYNPYLGLVSVTFCGLGGYFLYYAGKSLATGTAKPSNS
jgi:hypothetical protein